MSFDENGVPVAPDSLQIYNSYKVDPQFARAFTWTWISFTTLYVLFSAPRVVRSVRNGRFWAGLRGVGEWLHGYERIEEEKRLENSVVPLNIHRGRVRRWTSVFLSWTYYQPWKSTLDLGQILVLAGYLTTLLVCILQDAQLRKNSNRAGFLTLAQLPLLFLAASKNSVLAILLGKGYEKLNFVHRWVGRAMLLSATVHGSLWIISHRKLHVSLNQDKERHGLSAYAILCSMILISLRPVRNRLYQFFFITHVCGSVAFFVLICYHTPYASPWIYPPLAFYGLDFALRLVRTRFKPATLTATDQLLTQINVERCEFGWVAGQHVRLRVLLDAKVFETHPLSIANATEGISCISSSRGKLLLGARVVGDWSKTINDYALKDQGGCCEKEEGKEIYIVIDGPYGGIGFDLGDYENVLLVAGGAGVTFTMGALDDLVGRIVNTGRKNGEITRHIEFSWCIKSFGCINWFAPQLQEIAEAARKEPTLSLHFKFFVTCLCDPEALPHIHNSETTMERPSVPGMLQGFLSSETQGGAGVVAAGPDGLVREARNSVARLGGSIKGGVALHTEIYCL